MEMTICWAIWQRSGYGNSLHHLPIINTGCSRQLINMRTTPRISVVIIWSVRFRDIFRTDLPVTRTTGWERIGNDNRILCRTGHAIWRNVRSRLPCRNAAWLSNPEHHELISTFSPVARLWGYTGIFARILLSGGMKQA